MPRITEQTTIRVASIALMTCLASGMLPAEERAASEAETTGAAEKRSVSVQEGVFTETQAERGRAVFDNFCAECHFPLEYSAGYLNGWARQPVYDLFERLRATMPYLEPGSLRDEQYADVVALLLSLNGVPSGATELPAQPEQLSDIVLEGPFR